MRRSSPGRSARAWRAAAVEPRSCGREGPPITSLDLGPSDTDDVRFAWGANMAVRRAAFERVGPFDATLADGGDEQEWQERLLAWHRATATRRFCTSPRAALDHRRSPADARLRPLARAARARGRASRRFDARRGEAPGVAPRAAHARRLPRPRRPPPLPGGPVMVAHSLGRLRTGPARTARRDPPAASPAAAARRPRPQPDFLSGESGTVGGLDGAAASCIDRSVDARELLGGRRRRLDARPRAARPPAGACSCWASSAPSADALAGAIRAELARSRHDVEVHTLPAGRAGQVREPQPPARGTSRVDGSRLAARGRRRRRAPARLPRPPAVPRGALLASTWPSRPTACARTPPGRVTRRRRGAWRARRRSSRSAP